MPHLIPALLAKSPQEAQQKLEAILPIAQLFQLDVMDGKFVPNETWHDAQAFATFNSPLDVELHLMVNDPERVVLDWLHLPNLKRILWHIEIPIDHQALIDLCKHHKLECGLALSPETPVSATLPLLNQLDEVLLLGVNPGWSGQALIPATLEKIQALKQLRSNLPVGFDGGVDEHSISKLVSQGVDRLYTASALFKNGEVAPNFAHLEALMQSTGV